MRQIMIHPTHVLEDVVCQLADVAIADLKTNPDRRFVEVGDVIMTERGNVKITFEMFRPSADARASRFRSGFLNITDWTTRQTYVIDCDRGSHRWNLVPSCFKNQEGECAPFDAYLLPRLRSLLNRVYITDHSNI